ncbi:MAG: hypothetical protein AAF661_15115 [Pseudomonadota bacterium]
MIRFKSYYAPYNPGEVAGFDKETEARLVDIGKAEFVSGEQAPARDKMVKDPSAGKRKARATSKAVPKNAEGGGLVKAPPTEAAEKPEGDEDSEG